MLIKFLRESLGKMVEKVYGKVIWVFSFFILLLFVWFSLVSTSTVSMMEKIYLTDISGIYCLIIFVIVLFLSVIPFVNRLLLSFGKKLDTNIILFRTLYFSILFLILLMSVSWVFLTDFMSWADSADIQKAAAGLLSGDYSSFIASGYIGRWQNQIGLTLIEAVLIRIFGDHSHVFFQLINACCIPVIASSLTRFTESKFGKLSVLLMGLLWFPLLFSVSHVYGNVPGLMLSLLAFCYHFDHFNSGRLRQGILSAFLMAFACLIKQNYIIFLIAYILICIVNSLKRKKSVYAVMALSAVLLSVLFTWTATGITEHITAFKMEGGVSKWSYIAMAMQEGDRAAGWFNGYNTNSYDLAGCDTSVQSEFAKEEIRKSLSAFFEHPSYMISFYTKKLASQWNEPTFQTIWYLRGPGRDLPDCIDYMISIYGSYRVLPYFKFFEVMIYLAAFLFICFEKKLDDKSLLLLTTFTGGVLFHILWEAKSQYALFYFVLLIPICINGIGAFRKCCLTLFEKKEMKRCGRVRKDLIACFVLFLIILGILYCLHIPASLKEESLSYYQYIVENSI